MAFNKLKGSRVWYIPDGFSPSDGLGLDDGHESICIINDMDKTANIKIKFFFENECPVEDIEFKLHPQRCKHLRLNDPKNLGGFRLDVNKPYSIKLESDIDIIVQYSRLTSYNDRFSLMTTMGYSI